MDLRRNTNRHDRSRGVQVPQRPGVSLSSRAPKAPVQVPQPVIPLLDEKKPTPRFAGVLPILKFPFHSRKRAVLSLCLLLVVGYIGTHLPKKDPASIKGAQTTNIRSSSEQLEQNTTPEFTTVLPAGKKISDYGGWTRISPKGRTPVYAYADKLNNVPIRVSEQKVPDNPDSGNAATVNEWVGKLAADFEADQKLTMGDITAYIGTSVKGPQSIIFTKNGLLILITSDQKIDTEHWTAYISSLQ